jgi:hypothetical protein
MTSKERENFPFPPRENLHEFQYTYTTHFPYVQRWQHYPRLYVCGTENNLRGKITIQKNKIQRCIWAKIL